MATAMPARFLTAGLRFFVTALLLGFVLLAVAPIDAVRLLCVFALVCAAAGLILHVVALRAIHPDALAALTAETGSHFRRLRNYLRRAFSATHDATETVWPGAVR
jgi:hypothetical protein